ncbi:MAG: Ig-like domain-containing protein, partial [Burkholderiaceae bacterium]|nr:Ig-like domain-containing protein [Burkholderiaceae bacterium]
MATIPGTSGDDTLIGGAGNDLLDGNAGNDTLQGLGGDDILDGGAGDDSLDGGANGAFGDVVDYAGATSGVVVDLTAGTAADGQGGSDTLAGIEHINGTAYADNLTGNSASNWFSPGAGNDTLNGAGGSDFVMYQLESAPVVVNLLAGTAMGASTGADALVSIENAQGSYFDDQITLANAAGAAYGRAGNDSLTGGTADDALTGGSGNDTLRGGAGTDVANYADELFDGGATPITGLGVTVNLATGVATDNWGHTDTLDSIELVYGTGYADSLTGGNPANGSAATDGFEGLRGNGGNDTLDGGTGYDRADYTSSPAAVNVTLGGTASGTAQDGFGNTDTLINIEDVRGSDYNDTLTGSDSGGFESFEGRAGNDTIDGLGGTDRVSYQTSPAGVTVNLLSGTASDGWGGSDVLRNIENIRGSDLGDSLTGDVKDNDLEGRAGNDSLAGGDGQDSLSGGGGNDNLDGGSGNDQLRGDAGNDTLLGGDGNDYMNGGSGDDSLVGGIGSDTADYFYSDTSGPVNANLATGVVTGGGGNDALSGIENVNGSDFDDVLVGDAQNNTLEGRGGNDSLSGGAGSDFMRGGLGNDTLDGGEILDRVNYIDLNTASYSDSTSGIVVNLQSGVVQDGLGGVDTLINMNWITGSSFADVITGSTFNNLFEEFQGLAGNDTIDGGANIASSGNRVTYANSPAAVNASLSTGQASDGFGDTDTLINISFLRGSAFGDVLTGSDATGYTEFFDGRAGNDTIDGRGGRDTLRFDAATVGVNVNLATGTVSDGQGGTDAVLNIENARGSGFNDVLTGDAGANDLDARGGNDSLFGGDGQDSLRGGAGNDTLDGGAQHIVAGATMRENWAQSANQGSQYDIAFYTDATSGVTVMLGADGTDGSATGEGVGTDVLINVEYVIGSAYNDSISGSNRAVSEVFRGGAGNDTIQGGSGTGTDLGFNYVDYRFGAGPVTVNLATGSATGADGNDVLQGTFSGILGGDFNDVLTGNAQDNSFDAGGGDDTIDGGAGWDALGFGFATSGVRVDMAAGTASGAAGNDSFIGIEAVRGSEFADTLTGSNGDDDIQGRAGNDSINGGAGNDTLHGGYGDDVMDGGQGFDVAVFSGASTDYTLEFLPGGRLSLTSTAEGIDTLSDIEVFQFADRGLQLLVGKVADGYISGASIYIDTDRDGIADPGEATGIVTDAQGNFKGALPLDTPILAIGGTNIDTGLSNRLVLAAPQGSKVITPLTTLIQSQIALTGQSISQAEAAVQVALGLSADVDLTQYDPLAQAAGNATALAVQSAAAQVAELGARAVAEGTVFSAITGAIAAGIQAGQMIDLTDRAKLETLLGSVASDAALDEAATTNTAIAAADSIDAISAIQSIAGDETAPTVLGFTPLDNATGVAVGASISFTFDEVIARGIGSIVLKTAAGVPVETFDATTSTLTGAMLTLNPGADLAYGTHYELEVAAGAITDLAGNPYAGTTRYDFTTAGVSGGLTGTNADDQLQGTAGNDTLTPGLGHDTVNAGAGVDTVVLPLFPNVYRLTESSPGHVSGSYAAATLHLNDVELVQFGR